MLSVGSIAGTAYRGRHHDRKPHSPSLATSVTKKTQACGVKVVSEKRPTDCQSVQENIVCFVDNVCCSYAFMNEVNVVRRMTHSSPTSAVDENHT